MRGSPRFLSGGCLVSTRARHGKVVEARPSVCIYSSELLTSFGHHTMPAARMDHSYNRLYNIVQHLFQGNYLHDSESTGQSVTHTHTHTHTHAHTHTHTGDAARMHSPCIRHAIGLRARRGYSPSDPCGM